MSPIRSTCLECSRNAVSLNLDHRTATDSFNLLIMQPCCSAVLMPPPRTASLSLARTHITKVEIDADLTSHSSNPAFTPENNKELKDGVGAYLDCEATENKADENYPLSLDCAAVFMSSSCFLGAAAAAPISALALSYLGFTAVGVAKGSLAAWWQSLLGYVAEGSLFSMLQSIAMTGAGSTIYTVGGVFGGFMTKSVTNKKTVKYVAGMCRRIDREVSQKTKVGRMIEANTAAVKAAIKIKDAAISTAGGAWGFVKSWSPWCSSNSSKL